MPGTLLSNFRVSAITQRIAALAALALGCVAVASPASAQVTEQATSEATILEPLTLVNTADMDFGIITNVIGGGTVDMAPTTSPSCTPTGGLIHSGACQPAVFEGFGQTGRIVLLDKPSGNTITLTGPGGATMEVTNVILDVSPDLTYISGNPASNGFVRYRIDSPSGVFAFRAGGILNVNAGQATGTYTGTFSVRINYQ